LELVLIRHTVVDAPPGLCYGRLDLPLAASAEADIAAVLAALPPVGAVISSPAARCRLLAAELARRDGCPLAFAPDLRELDFGDWEGIRWDAINRAQSDPWADDPWNRAPPGGESEARLWARVEGWWARWRAPVGVERVAVVAHGGPLRLLRCRLAGAALADRWSYSLEPGGVTMVTVAARGAHAEHGEQDDAG
jgi:alpha-ribazole phosphatase